MSIDYGYIFETMIYLKHSDLSAREMCSMEKLQQDSSIPLDLDDHKQKVLAEIDAVKTGAQKPAPDNNIVSEALTSAAGGSIFSAAMLVGEESRANKASNSMFVGGGSAGGKAAKSRTSLMPHQTYSEKKEMARAEVRTANGKPARDGDVMPAAR